MNPAIFQMPFVEAALPIMFTILVAVWVNNRSSAEIGKRLDDMRIDFNLRFDEQRSDFNRRFDQVNRNFDDVKTRLDRIETKLGDHDVRIARIEERVSPLVRA